MESAQSEMVGLQTRDSGMASASRASSHSTPYRKSRVSQSVAGSRGGRSSRVKANDFDGNDFDLDGNDNGSGNGSGMGLDPNNADDVYVDLDATWGEVWNTCCCFASSSGYLRMISGVLVIFSCLFLFGLGLEFLSNGAKVMAGCAAGQLFGNDTNNPVTGVMIGILATVMLQSSSTTTTIIVSLVGVQGSALSVQNAIYMVMGANIGTAVTNTFVSLSHIRDPEQFELAFAGATLHDMFNFMTVAILLPVEAATGFLERVSSSLTKGADTEDGDTWEGPVKRFITPVGKKVIVANKKAIEHVSKGGDCSDFYPIRCDDNDDPTYGTCKVGILACDKTSGDCPAFFSPTADLRDDKIAGLCSVVIGSFVIFVSLSVLVFVVQRLLLGYSTRVIYKVTKLNGYVLIAIGTTATMLLQSSSTTTSFLTPFVGMNAIPVEQMLPLTIGANLGTTITALFSALATDGNQALQVAVAHLMFNLTGFMIWYPIPIIRNIPIAAANRLGMWVRLWRPLALLYIGTLFIGFPATVLGLSALYNRSQAGLQAIAGVLTGLIAIGGLAFLRWFYFREGRDITIDWLSESGRKIDAKYRLADDMKRAQHTIHALRDFTGLGHDVNTIDGYADMTRIVSRREALNDLADDMEWVEEKLAALIYYTGLPEEFLEPSEGNTRNTGRNMDTDYDSDDPERPDRRISLEGSDDEDQRRFRPSSVWNNIPRYFICIGFVSIPLAIWGIIALWNEDTKGTRGFALFFASLLVGWMLFVVCFIFFGTKYVLDYLEHVNRTDAAIQSLPQDIAFIKSNIRVLFMHSNVKMENLKQPPRRRRQNRHRRNEFDQSDEL